jgi:hypothetical protein
VPLSSLDSASEGALPAPNAQAIRVAETQQKSFLCFIISKLSRCDYSNEILTGAVRYAPIASANTVYRAGGCAEMPWTVRVDCATGVSARSFSDHALAFHLRDFTFVESQFRQHFAGMFTEGGRRN